MIKTRNPPILFLHYFIFFLFLCKPLSLLHHKRTPLTPLKIKTTTRQLIMPELINYSFLSTILFFHFTRCA
ncbi:hypothetical protein F5H01DRAFT_352216 [Linnemannia elongata]|nr:hypothetical protein F5H01DRAFT_352216 [Linnemannia elongata]